MEVKIEDWNIEEWHETFDYVQHTAFGKKIITGTIKADNKTGTFRYYKYWEYGNNGVNVEVDIDLPKEKIKQIKKYLQNEIERLVEEYMRG